MGTKKFKKLTLTRALAMIGKFKGELEDNMLSCSTVVDGKGVCLTTSKGLDKDSFLKGANAQWQRVQDEYFKYLTLKNLVAEANTDTSRTVKLEGIDKLKFLFKKDEFTAFELINMKNVLPTLRATYQTQLNYLNTQGENYVRFTNQAMKDAIDASTKNNKNTVKEVESLATINKYELVSVFTEEELKEVLLEITNLLAEVDMVLSEFNATQTIEVPEHF